MVADNIISPDVGTVSALPFIIMAKIEDHGKDFAVISGRVEAQVTYEYNGAPSCFHYHYMLINHQFYYIWHV